MMDSVRIPKRSMGDDDSDPLEYMIFVWNGKKTAALLKVDISVKLLI